MFDKIKKFFREFSGKEKESKTYSAEEAYNEFSWIYSSMDC